MQLDESFEGDELDTDIWFPYYLPHWSSRADSAATYEIHSGVLRLSIPSDQPLWCPEDHAEPLRVSCIQTGSFSGPVGTKVGQQPFRDDLVVREEQPIFCGYTPTYGRVEVTMCANVTPRSMFAFWMSGFEDRPQRCGEICVAEVFGEGVAAESVQVGIGVHAFRDPDLREDFFVLRQPIDVTEFHTYGVDWNVNGVVFSIDGQQVMRSDQSPDYPMQLMIGLFDFPARAESSSSNTPELFVSGVRGMG